VTPFPYHQKANAVKQQAFILRAERAFARVARKLRRENRKRGLAPVVWPNGNPRRESRKVFNAGRANVESKL
jgi:hypothetical protein